MVSEWREEFLGDPRRLPFRQHPSKENAFYWNGSIPWVSAKDMKRLFLDDAEDHITEECLRHGTKLAPANMCCSDSGHDTFKRCTDLHRTSPDGFQSGRESTATEEWYQV